MVLILLFLIFIPGQAHDVDDLEVHILKKVGSRCFTRSLEDFGPVVDEKTFLELTASETLETVHNRCGFLKELRVDFNNQSLLVYRVRGDCFGRATATLTRNDTTKTYTLHVTRIYGGCRAAGSFEGWLVVDKLLPDYKVESVVTERDASGEERIRG